MDSLLVEPGYHFTYPGLSWVRPLPGSAMYGVLAVMFVAALALAVGWRPRWSAAAFTVALLYVEAIDVTTYLNHYELVTLLGVLCVVLPIPGRGRWHRTTVPSWAIGLLRFQLGVVYVFAGLGKLDVDWLVHGEPLHTWLLGRSDLPVVGSLLALPATAVVLSWAGAVFDLSVVAFLLRRRTRGWAYVAVVAFHVATGLLFPAIGVFPLVMIAATPLFFDPDWPDRVRRVLGRSRVGVPVARHAPNPVTHDAATAFAVAHGRHRRLGAGAAAGAAPPPRLPGRCAVDRGGVPLVVASAPHREGGHRLVPGDGSDDGSYRGGLSE